MGGGVVSSVLGGIKPSKPDLTKAENIPAIIPTYIAIQICLELFFVNLNRSIIIHTRLMNRYYEYSREKGNCLLLV